MCGYNRGVDLGVHRACACLIEHKLHWVCDAVSCLLQQVQDFFLWPHRKGMQECVSSVLCIVSVKGCAAFKQEACRMQMIGMFTVLHARKLTMHERLVVVTE